MTTVLCSRWKLGLLLLASCGRVNFDPRNDGAPGGSDSDGTTGDLGCWPAWKSGSPTVSAPRPIDQLNTPQYEGDPYLAADGQTFYLLRATTTFDIFVTRREERGMPFDPPALDTALTSTADDGRVSLSGDGLLAAISKRQPTNYDIWLADRVVPTDPFSNPSQALVATLITPDAQHDPELSRDGNRLYYATGPTVMNRVMVAERPDRSAPFGMPVPVANLLTAATTADATLSPDELVIVYSATITTEPFDLYFATRTAITEPFGPSQPVPSVNLPAIDDGDAALSPDGCELFFSTSRTGQRDIYIADVQ
ncbi:MAG TPA: hypothetical protein VIV11_25050 [Kofleriaceae bacterium]